MRYVKSLDGLRGSAILLVMLFHFELLGFGWIGVQMFFVLSGFLITQILLADKTAIPEKSFLLKRFYWRRVLRIFPIYFLYLFLLVLISLFVKIPNLKDSLLFLFTYSYNYTPLFLAKCTSSEAWGHFWSLAVEEQFYLVWPFLIVFLPVKKIKYVLIALLFLAPFTRFIFGELFRNSGVDIGKALYWITPSQIDSLSTGALIAALQLHVKIKKTNLLAILAALLFLLTGMWNLVNYSCSLGTLGFTAHAREGYQYVYNYSAINIATGLLIIVLFSNTKNFIHAVFSNSLLVDIGKISYGMYIVHQAVNIFIAYFMGDVLNIHGKPLRVLFFILYFFIVYFVAKISFRYFESFFLGLKEKAFVSKKIM